MTLDEFVKKDLEESGKTEYTFEDAKALTERWIAYKTAAAAPFEGWLDDGEAAAVDVLLFGEKVTP